MAAPEVAITVNSPGEVSTWLAPVMRELRRLDGRIRTTVFVLPCTYAAGTETKVVASIPGIDAVVPPGQSLRFALWGKVPEAVRRFERGALLFLGGEFFLAARLVRRLKAAGLAYSAGYINSAGAFERVFAPRESAKAELVRRGVPPESVDVVGDLMVDAARGSALAAGRDEARELLGIGRDDFVVALFPGSRPFEFRYALRFFARAAARLRAECLARGWDRPLSFVAPVAPFIDERAVSEALAAVRKDPGARAELDVGRLLGTKASAGGGDPGRRAEGASSGLSVEIASPGLRGEVASSGLLGESALPDLRGEGASPGWRGELGTVSPRGVEGRFDFGSESVSVRFFRGLSTAVIAAADMALTVPGSNNAEMAVWGLPMVVCLPLDKPEEIPIDGIMGLVDRIPLVGRRLKAKAVLKVAERTTFVSLPNRVAREMIVPELRSRTLLADDVAGEALKLLLDPERRAGMSRKLVSTMGPPGAAEKVARGLLEAAYRAGGM